MVDESVASLVEQKVDLMADAWAAVRAGWLAGQTAVSMVGRKALTTVAHSVDK
jgi:hypothetical protein